MSVSQLLTARAEFERCARVLAAAVASWQVVASRENALAMHEALVEFNDAKKVLDA